MKLIPKLIATIFCLIAYAAMGKDAQITFKVIDDFEKPVQGVEVTMSTFEQVRPGTETARGLTDKDGLVTLKHSGSTGLFGYGIVPQGNKFYYTKGGDYVFANSKAGRWLPWNPTVEILVKPVVKPVPMFAKRTYYLEFPGTNKAYGFDLMAADWVAPYGKGISTDILINLRKHFVNVYEPYDLTVNIKFANTNDGIQAVLVNPKKGSELRLPRYAPEAGYLPELTVYERREARGKPIVKSESEDQNYFFRVRTIVNENGRIKSALYGKIYGDFQTTVFKSAIARLLFTYYLNPEENSRNMEFDRGKNLFKKLDIEEKVNLP